MPHVEVPAHLPDDVAVVYAEMLATYQPGPDLESFAGQVARLRDAQQRISEEGLIVVDGKGVPIAHPALTVERQAQAEVRAWSGKLKKVYRS